MVWRVACTAEGRGPKEVAKSWWMGAAVELRGCSRLLCDVTRQRSAPVAAWQRNQNDEKWFIVDAVSSHMQGAMRSAAVTRRLWRQWRPGTSDTRGSSGVACRRGDGLIIQTESAEESEPRPRQRDAQPANPRCCSAEAEEQKKKRDTADVKL